MPAKAWSSWGELRNYKDSSFEDDPDLGQPNATLPDWKTKELRRAYYSSISFIDAEIGRVLDLLQVLTRTKLA